MANLALLDVLLPYVFRGENLGALHAALSTLRVVTFEQATDDLGVALRGQCEVNGRLRLFPATGTLTADVDEATPAHDPARSDPIFDLADTTVDFANALSLFDMLRPHASLLAVPDADHLFTTPPSEIAFLAETLDRFTARATSRYQAPTT